MTDTTALMQAQREKINALYRSVAAVDKPSADAGAINYSRGRDKFDNNPEQRQAADFSEFKAWVLSTRSKAKGQKYICAPMSLGPHDRPEEYAGEGHWRLKNRCMPRRFAPFDFDGFESPEVADQVFAYLGSKYNGFGYYTSSSTPEAPRARAILELDREVNRAECEAVCTAIQAEIEEKVGVDAVKFDNSVYRGEQPVYTPVGDAESFDLNGKPVDVDALLGTSVSKSSDKPAGEVPAYANLFELEHPGTAKEYPPSSALKVADECAQVRYMRDKQGAVSEPEWRNGMGVLKHTVEGDALCHEWSKGDPRYDAKETQKKIDAWATGPTLCETFAKENKLCNGCTQRGKIASPIVLGYEDKRDETDISDTANEKSQDAQRDKVINALKQAGMQLAVEENGETYVLAKIGNTPTAMNLESGEAMDSMIVAIRNATGKTLSPDILKRETAILRVEARSRGEVFKKHKRIAAMPGGYAINLANRAGQVVFVTPGEWEVRQNEDIYFAHGGGIGEMPSPIRPPDVASALRTLNDAWEFLGIPPMRRLILTVAVVNAFRTGVPYVVIESIGGAGSGKSTVTNALVQLIDPTATGKPTDTALSAEHLAAVAQVRQAIVVDNSSRISAGEQDLCCKAAYGFVVGVRKLYSNADVMLIPLHVQIILNGIVPLITRGDLLERSLRLELPQRDSYVSEEEILRWFTEIHPRLFGALLELLAAGLDLLPAVRAQRQWRHRMVDFAQLGEAIAQAGGMGPGAFIQQLDEMRRSTAAEIVTGDPITEGVIKVISKLGQNAVDAETYPAWRKWEKQGWYAVKKDGALHVGAKASAIRSLLDTYAPAQRKEWWPDNDRAMRGALLRIQPILRDLGISCTQRDVNGGKTCWLFIWVPERLES